MCGRTRSVMDTKTKDAAVFRAMLNRDSWQRFGAAVQNVLWTNTNLRTIFGHLADLHDKTSHNLTPDEALLYLESVRPEGDAAVSLAHQFMDVAPEISDDVLRECIRESAARGLSLHAAQSILGELQNSNDFDPSAAHAIMREAVEAHSADAVHGRILDLMESGVADIAVDRPLMATFGFGERLDYCAGGGTAAGEVSVIIAGAKKGKTTALSKTGLENALLGRKVLHITLENPPLMCARRYDSGLTGLDYRGLTANSHVAPRARKRIEEAGGFVKIVNWQYEDRSPSEIVPLVRETEADLVLIDYLQLMSPDRTKGMNRWEKRHLLSKLGKDTCRAATELRLPIITAWQSNREGAARDTVSALDVAESWDTVQHATTILGISASDEEKHIGRLRVHTLLTRYSSTPGSVRFKVDLEKNTWEIDE